MDKFRSRNYVLVLYPDDPTHVQALDKICASYTYAGILHDKDIYEDDVYDVTVEPPVLVHAQGELKKPHFHIVAKFGGNGRWNTALAEELGVEVNYLQQCSSIDGALLYLLHANNPEKYQYDLENAFGTLVPRLRAILADQEDEGTRVLQILEIIDSIEGYATYRQVLSFACKSGLWAQFRKLGSGVKYLIDEHNYLLSRSLVDELREYGDSQREMLLYNDPNFPFK